MTPYSVKPIRWSGGDVNFTHYIPMGLILSQLQYTATPWATT